MTKTYYQVGVYTFSEKEEALDYAIPRLLTIKPVEGTVGGEKEKKLLIEAIQTLVFIALKREEN